MARRTPKKKQEIQREQQGTHKADDSKFVDELAEILRREVDARLGSDATYEQRRDAEAELMRKILWKREDDDLRESATSVDVVEIAGKRYRRLDQPSSARRRAPVGRCRNGSSGQPSLGRCPAFRGTLALAPWWSPDVGTPRGNATPRPIARQSRPLPDQDRIHVAVGARARVRRKSKSRRPTPASPRREMRHPCPRILGTQRAFLPRTAPTGWTRGIVCGSVPARQPLRVADLRGRRRPATLLGVIGVMETNAIPAGSVIELGCGARKRNASYIGVDLLPYEGVDVVGDALEVLRAVPKASLRGVCSYHFIEHLENVPELVGEIARVIRPGGFLETVAPHFSNPYYFSDLTHKTTFGLYTFSYLARDMILTRRVPTYKRTLEFELVDVQLRFKSSPPFYVRHIFKRMFGACINFSTWTKEFYEENLTGIVPCYEIYYRLMRLE